MGLVLENLVIRSEIGRKRDEIKKVLYNIPEQEYIILKDYIKIVRVLHGSKKIYLSSLNNFIMDLSMLTIIPKR